MGEITTSTDASGKAGDITINADNVTLAESGLIASTTSGSGNGGSITVNAADALGITGYSSSISTGTLSGNDGGFDGGDAGHITVTAESIRLIEGGSLRSETRGSGKGGSIVVDTGALEITGDPDRFRFDGYGIVAGAFVFYGFGGGRCRQN